MSISYQPRLFKTQLAAFIKQFLRRIYTNDISYEHIVAAQGNYLPHLTFYADRAFRDKRRRNFHRIFGVQPAFRELVGLCTCLYAAVVHRPYYIFGGQIDNELTALLYHLVGISLRSYRNISHRRSCAEYACPRHSQHVYLAVMGAAYQRWRQRRCYYTAFPVFLVVGHFKSSCEKPCTFL